MMQQKPAREAGFLLLVRRFEHGVFTAASHPA
jgi:hypothetical protein